MKKTLMIIGLMAGIAASSNAGNNVTVGAANGFFLSNDTTGLLELSPNGWVQLIYFSTGSASTQVLPGGTIGANETILAQFAIQNGNGSDQYGSFTYDFTSPQTAGSWYARVFAGGSSTTGASGDNIIVGTYYYQSSVFAVLNNTTPETPDIQSVHGNNNSTSFPGADIVNFQVVPEPTVLAFIGIGGLALAVRRRFMA